MSILAKAIMSAMGGSSGGGTLTAPAAIGAPYAGGYYAGMILQSDGVYALVVAPKATGQNNSVQYKTVNSETIGTESMNDGLANTNSMIAAGSHPVATWVDNLTIGGFTDWYLPSKDELEVCYRNLKPTTNANTVGDQGYGFLNGANANSVPIGAGYTSGNPAQTAITAFRTGGAEAFDSAWYWSSTQFAANTAGAWVQYFNGGNQSLYNKHGSLYARAVRRVQLLSLNLFYPTSIGSAWQGGYFGGLVKNTDGSVYGLVVSDKSTETQLQAKTTNDTTTGTASIIDGVANSNAMNNTAHPAAKYCNDLTSGGYTDWYLPARDELEVLYRNLKPTTQANSVAGYNINGSTSTTFSGTAGSGTNLNSIPTGGNYTTTNPAMTSASAFASGGAQAFVGNVYWASTEYSTVNNWLQDFASGTQSSTNKNTTCYVRPIRRVLMTFDTLTGKYKPVEAPAAIGAPYQGGYYAGMMQQADGIYALVVAPKASGHSTGQVWNPSNAVISGTTSLNDGLANTNAMIANGNCPVATWVDALNIGGFNDWYLPARDELELLYRNLKPTTQSNSVDGYNIDGGQNAAGTYSSTNGSGTNLNSIPKTGNYTTATPAQTAITAFRTGGAEAFDSAWYWSSTQYAANTAGAWRQLFIDGNQNYANKNLSYYARAVRRVKL